MESKDYIIKGTQKTNGFYAEIIQKSNNKIIYKKKCLTLDDAVSEALRKWDEIKNQ